MSKVDFLVNGDFGITVLMTVMEDNVAKDVSAATGSLTFRVKKPGTTTITTWTATFNTDGTDGKVKYDLLTGDIDTVGDWEIFLVLVRADATAFTWNTRIVKFKVFAKF